MTIHPGSVEVNKALVRRAIGYNHGADDAATEIFAPDFVVHMPGQPAIDRETFERVLGGFGAGFPGYTYEIQDQIAQGDTVFNRVTWRGVHTGEFAGVAATHRPIEMSGINAFKVRDGRVVAQWAQLDMFGLLQQIGVIPPA